MPLKVWQVEVTHITEFGKLKYVHVSVDTCSGIIHATPLSGEKTRNVMGHCLEAWAAWGKPQQLKMDNGPAYMAQTLSAFCQQMEVVLNHRSPYPQGQDIIKCAHCTLKKCLTLDGLSAADRHHRIESNLKGYVKWKDVITGLWHGPDPVLAWVRGAVCVFPTDRQDLLWVPERLTRKCNHHETPDNAVGALSDVDGSDSGTKMGDPLGISEANANMS